MILVWLIILLPAQSRGDLSGICERCNCTDKDVDCTSAISQSQFNETLTGLNLKQIILDRNEIVHLKPFPDFEVIHLSLKYNQIARIDDASFKFVKNLTVLDLSFNHLTSDRLTPHIFRGNYSPEYYWPYYSLKILRLSSNSLHTLHEDLFEHLVNLEMLFLDSNPFKLIDTPTILAISSLSQLQMLDLSYTMLSELPPTLFHTPKYLEVVNISGNSFTHVPKSLGESHSLEELVLDYNPIEELIEFPPLKNLKILRINNMQKLKEIKDHALSNLTKLEELYCSHNEHLSKISGFALSKAPEIPEESDIWPPVKKVFFNKNNLRKLDSNLLGNWNNLESLDLQDNPWLCDCENQWLITTLIPEIKTNHLNHTIGLICHEPGQMRGESMNELSERNYHMRCLDLFGNHPERDATILIIVLIGVLLAIPMALLAFVMYRRYYHPNINYSRAFYRKADSLESFS